MRKNFTGFDEIVARYQLRLRQIVEGTGAAPVDPAVGHPANGDLVLVRPTDERGGGALLRLIHRTEGDGRLLLTCNHTASPPISLFRNDCLWMAPVVAIIRQLR